jgi:hypothetical protein
MHNAMAFALIRAGFVSNKRGLFRDGWSSKLSYRTYQALKAQGIPANQNEQMGMAEAHLQAA